MKNLNTEFNRELQYLVKVIVLCEEEIANSNLRCERNKSKIDRKGC